MISAIIFDFGKVICTFDVQIFLARIARSTGKPLQHVQALMPALSSRAMEYETGLISSGEFFLHVSTICGLSISKDEFIDAYCRIFTPIPATFDLVRQLKPRYKLALLSNTSEWHFEYGIKPVSIFPLFDAVTLSYEVKAMKPARAIYLDVLRKLRVPPHECVYIDDMRENVDAAIALAVHGIHYTSHTDLLASLRRLQVAVD